MQDPLTPDLNCDHRAKHKVLNSWRSVIQTQKLMHDYVLNMKF